MAKVTMLIAIKDAADADELEAWASDEGYRVTDRVSSGNDAVARAQARHPSVVLLDSHPGGTVSLDEIITRIQLSCGIPVVLVAASDGDLPDHDQSSAHPFGYLVRPFGTRMFRQVVEAALYRHSHEDIPGGKNAAPSSRVRKVAHDINNSLSSALANIQLARRSGAHKDDVHRHLDDAEKSVLRARDHSRHLLAPPGDKGNRDGATRDAQASVKHQRTPSGGKKGAATGYRILLMDDEEAILSATSDMLSFLGHAVTIAKSGAESVNLFREARSVGVQFDVVILDITVPGGIGAEETLPLLREIEPDVRAIISSGYATHPLLVNFAESGFAAALVKPYGFKELEESLARVSIPK